MQFLTILLLALMVFGLCCAVLIFKNRREGGAARLHSCGDHKQECRCGAANAARCNQHPPFDLKATLEKARHID